ncbi:MAG: linear amide C-N hydrolase [Clostridia bacterium]|nr:linear amide C-N hydrolase [Clostridia bacterium]
MCTSLALPTADGRQLFGRTLDLDTHFGERVTLTPRRYPFRFSYVPALTEHHAILGMAAVADGAVADGYPLYAEAMNNRGLCMAGLRFAGNAVYADRPAAGKINLAPWELIPYLLGKYATVNQVRNALREIRLIDQPFSSDLPAAPLHWHIADSDPTHGGLILEVTADGMRVYDSPANGAGVLTNNPPYAEQLAFLAEYSAVRGDAPGLPGDYSSPSRFVRAATFRRWMMEWMETQHKDGEGKDLHIEVTPVTQFLRILAAVSPMAGAVFTKEGKSHRTLYTCCMDSGAGVYHYFTEEDTAVRSVSFASVDMEGSALVCP